jgi:hypothetical protein
MPRQSHILPDRSPYLDADDEDNGELGAGGGRTVALDGNLKLLCFVEDIVEILGV